MTCIAPTLQAFFSDRLAQQRRASPYTVAAYRDTFRLLLTFAAERTGKAPATLDFTDLNATLIGDFLTHLETERRNRVRTRNTRLAAIRSFLHYASFYHPEHAADLQRALAIPVKRFDRGIVGFLELDEIAALLAAPNATTWTGRRDRTLLLLAVQTGFRLSELTGLVWSDIDLGTGPSVHCRGKGRKERAVPLTRQSVSALRGWHREVGGAARDPVFPTRRGGRLSPDAVQLVVRRHVAAAVNVCPSLQAKKVTPHVLRHTAAMQLLRGGVDTAVIALWLGHESIDVTQMYLHADLRLKEKALARTAPLQTKVGRYRPSDKLLAFLSGL
jgi:integrase/recombinase XerD